MLQGDANRSYSEEDQSSSNMEELDQFQEIQEGSGMIAQTISFAHIPLLLSGKSESRFGRKLAPTSNAELTFVLNLMLVCGVTCGNVGASLAS